MSQCLERTYLHSHLQEIRLSIKDNLSDEKIHFSVLILQELFNHFSIPVLLDAF